MAKTAAWQKIVAVVIGLVAVALIAAWQLDLWNTINPPRYQIPENLTSDEEKAIMAAQDTARRDKGRFIQFGGTTIFKNPLGNYRVRGTASDPFSTGKSVFVYEAIVDAKSFECNEFTFE
jgi:hypothetical protein